MFDQVELTHKPAGRIPIYMGVVNEKGLRLSGELADGTVLSVVAGTEYVSWARRVVTDAAVSTGRDPAAHRIVTYALCSVDVDGRRARAAVRDLVAFYLHAMPDNALSRIYGIGAHLQELTSRGDAAFVAREMPDQWVDDLAIAGDPDECATRLRALLGAGSDSIGLWLFPLERADDVARLLATEVFPRL
jgi:alkanesulfonate monooxygenase SsuD/methylene tetrahydromethanopterin reductase-like flavin-dependent oxidoreductase (luciferase family)